jgi:hypothetical protein
VPLTSDVPPGIRLGPALGLAALIVSGLALAWALLSYRRPRTGESVSAPAAAPAVQEETEERHDRAAR